MAYPIEVKENAIRLRKIGYSIKEVASLLKIAVGTSSLWLRRVDLPPSALTRLAQRRVLGQEKSRQIALNTRQIENKKLLLQSHGVISSIPPNQHTYALICALLFWAEGGKDISTGLRFSNSDPKMVKLCLTALQKSQQFSWSRLKAKLHLHNYHDPAVQTKFWASATNIPAQNFLRPYLKPNTATRKHENYPGCVSIYYYDNKVNRMLTALYMAIIDKYS